MSFHDSHVTWLYQTTKNGKDTRGTHFSCPSERCPIASPRNMTPTLGARSFSLAVSGVGHVSIVTRAFFSRLRRSCSANGLRTPFPSAAREKPLVPRVHDSTKRWTCAQWIWVCFKFVLSYLLARNLQTGTKTFIKLNLFSAHGSCTTTWLTSFNKHLYQRKSKNSGNWGLVGTKGQRNGRHIGTVGTGEHRAQRNRGTVGTEER